MAGVIPNVGEVNLLTQILAGAGQTWTLRLFSAVANGLTAQTKLSDFSECAFNGYRPQPIKGWAKVALDNQGRAFAVAYALAFARAAGGAGGDVAGYYVTDTGKTKLYWGEVDPIGPVSMNTTGAIYLVIPRLSLVSAN